MRSATSAVELPSPVQFEDPVHDDFPGVAEIHQEGRALPASGTVVVTTAMSRRPLGGVPDLVVLGNERVSGRSVLPRLQTTGQSPRKEREILGIHLEAN